MQKNLQTLIGIWQKIIEALKTILEKKKGINYITIHHSSSPLLTSVEEINQWHKEKGFTMSSLGFYCGYHYVILMSGEIKQTRLDNEEGCHTQGHNKGNIGICLTGNFNNCPPTKDQWKSLVALIDEKKSMYFIDDKEVKCHSDFCNTECPGENLRAMLKTKYNI